MFESHIGAEATDNFRDETDDPLVGNVLGDDVEEYLLINRSEEFLDVAFQDPAGARVVARDLVGKLPEAVHRPMRAFSLSARVRVGDKCSVEEWIELPVDRVMDETVTYRRLVDVTRLGIGDLEVMVGAVLVRSVLQFTVQLENVVR